MTLTPREKLLKRIESAADSVLAKQPNGFCNLYPTSSQCIIQLNTQSSISSLSETV